MRFLIFMFLVFTTTSFSFSQDLIFEHLRVKDGLSHLTIHDIYQDEFNQLWIATRDGLNKYDGNKISVFRPIIGDTLGLFGNNIQSVCGDKKGNLFLQCMNGLVTYSLITQKFHTISRIGVTHISYGSQHLWISSGNQIKYLDNPRGKMKPYCILKDDNKITSLLELSDNNLLVGTNNGLLMLDGNKKTSNIINDIHVVCIYEDKEKRIWVGTLKDGLFCIDTQNKIVNYRHEILNKNSISHNYVRAICQDDLGNYWIGTFSGLDLFNIENQKFQNFNHSYDDQSSISDFSIWCIEKDNQGSLWIGTFFGGVDKINPEYSFNQFYRPKKNNTGPNEAMLSNVEEEGNGNLWICSDNGGLNYFNVTDNKFYYFKHDPLNENSLSSNTLKALCLDKENNRLWIGSHLGGLDYLDLVTKSIRRISLGTNNPRIDKYVRCIQKYQDELILGTHDGIHRFNIKTHELTPLIEEKHGLNNIQVWDMIVDSNDRLWFSGNGTVYYYEIKKRKLNKLPNIRDIHLATFFEDKNKDIWIGSAGKGLFKYKVAEDKISWFYTLNSAIMDDYIIDINESQGGYILIATNKGLSRFDSDKNIFYNYYNNHYFPFESLNERCLHVTQKGSIVLCSTEGMMIVSERDLLFKSKPYTINFTSLSVNNQIINPLDESNLLSKSINVTDTLILHEKHTSLSIDFAVTNYIKALNPEVQYKLEGFDNDWVDAKSKTGLTYNNLSSGTYKLKIKSYDKSNHQEINRRDLVIIVKPHFYKSWYAYILYILIIGGILYLIYSQVALKSSLKYAAYKTKHQEEVNQSKLRFFINVSHEIRTPVTLIIAQLDTLLQNSGNLSPTMSSKLINIKRNANKLKRLINELLDFRKQEQGHVSLKVSEQDIVSYVKGIYSSFSEYAIKLNVNISFISKYEQIDVFFDPVQMDKVIYNLLSNAFKFTPPQGSVSVLLEKKTNYVELSVIDTGIGIKQEDINNIFTRFYQAQDQDHSLQNMDPGTGIGLALVKNIIELHKGIISVSNNPGGGTIFKISLPLGNSHFSDKDYIYNTFVKDPKIEQTEINNIASSTDSIQYDKDHDNKKHTVLIVEDNDDLRNLLIDVFSPIYNTDSIADGGKAFDIIADRKPDLVLLDIMLPNISGIELCKKIKSNLSTRYIPVVLLTATTASEKKIEGLHMGADDYITKPFDTKELILRCGNLINNRLTLKEVFASMKSDDNQIIATNEQDKKTIEKATSIVLNNIDNPDFNIDTFAEMMHMGRSSLFTKLKEVTGQTPKDFITEIRLKQALALLKERFEMSITDIAFAVGFSDSSYFIKLFKTNYGVTPHQYRKNNNK